MSVLPAGWTAEDLLAPHKSIPYNPDIANTFYRAGYIESWGRGIQKIEAACAALGAEPPEYLVRGNSITLKLKALFVNQGTDVPNVPKNVPNVPKQQENDLRANLIQLISQNPSISTYAMERELSVSRKTIQREINALKDAGVVKRVGSTRSGHWEIME